MKTKISLLISLFCLTILLPSFAQEKEIPKLDNPFCFLLKNVK